MVVSLNAPDVGFRVGFMSFSLPHSSIRLRLLMARPRARVGDGQRLQRSEGCPLPAKSRVARRMAAYGGTVHSRSALGKNRHRQDMAGSSPSLPDGSNPSAAIVQSASDVQCSRLLKTTVLPVQHPLKNVRKTLSLFTIMRKPVFDGYPPMLVGYMRVSSDSDLSFSEVDCT